MKRRAIIGCLVAVFLFVGSAHAAVDRGPYIGIGGSYAIQNFDTDELDVLRYYGFNPEFDNTWGINAKVGYKFNPVVSLEVAFEYLPGFNYSETSRWSSPPISIDADLDVLTVVLAGKFYPVPGYVRPYFTAGLGVMNASMDSTVSAAGYFPESAKEDETDACGKIGFGIDFFINPNLSFNVEGAYTVGFSDLDNIRYFTVSAGLGFHF